MAPRNNFHNHNDHGPPMSIPLGNTQDFNFNIQNHHPLGGADTAKSAQAQALLASLVGFIQPLIHVYVAAPDTAHACMDSVTAAARASNGTEGQELLEALEKFVAATLLPHAHNPKDMASGGEEDVRSDFDPVANQTGPDPVLALSIPRMNPSQDLPGYVVDSVYERVFSEMPIRVLAFDSNGSHLQLLERGAIVNHILSRVHASAPPSSEFDTINGLQLAEQASRYAILSHTWIRDTPGDVVYRDWATRELPADSRGYAKISKFCEIAAREHSVSLGWMDTVCINKESSTELDESIRSMYRWYRLAHVCVVYLAETPSIEKMHQDSWFTRGWTLQELLAPRNIKFYNKDWEPLVPISGTTGMVSDPDFYPEISDRLTSLLLEDGLEHESDTRFKRESPVEIQYQVYKATSITRLELLAFMANPSWEMVTISRKMQLAANRKVTREEDKIYSLMGLLGVGIPVVYGEGIYSAFMRLIREIMASQRDFLDIFNHDSEMEGLLPTSIADYLRRSSLLDGSYQADWATLQTVEQVEPIIFTHIGVRIPLLLVPAFRKDIYSKHVPEESVYLTVGVPHYSNLYRP